jgi:hypothetical protein
MTDDTRAKVQLKAQEKPDKMGEWRFVLIDMDSGKTIPISETDKVIIEYDGLLKSIKATVTLSIDEVDFYR